MQNRVAPYEVHPVFVAIFPGLEFKAGGEL